MAKRIKKTLPKERLPAKCRTGIPGIDEITFGGLPKNRATLISGIPGSGKTMFAMEFLIHGIIDFHEPGLFVSFEESETELIQNFVSLGYNLNKLIAKKQLIIHQIHIDKTEFQEAGNYNLDGLFIQLEDVLKKNKVNRVAFDTIELLFTHLKNKSHLRTEVQRLFRWFKRKKITIVVTAEQVNSTASFYGVEEFVADCVIILDTRVRSQVATRRLRIEKYRGSPHGTNEYPFLITNQGLFVFAITELKLDYSASESIIPSGIKQMDAMLGKNGFFKGSSILVTGPAGIGKTCIAAAFAQKTCERGEKCIFFAFEESPLQIIRNMSSVGIDLKYYITKGLLQLSCINPTSCGLELHLLNIQRAVNELKPSVVIIDPISNLKTTGLGEDVRSMLYRLIAFFKFKKVTSMMTSLVSLNPENLEPEESISSFMDVWIYTQYIQDLEKQSRYLLIRKARGMAHSKQVRELLIKDEGVELLDIYVYGNETITEQNKKMLKDILHKASINK